MPKFLSREELIDLQLTMNRRWLDDYTGPLADMEAGHTRVLSGNLDVTEEAVARSRRQIADLTSAIASLERQKAEGGDLSSPAVQIAP